MRSTATLAAALTAAVVVTGLSLSSGGPEQDHPVRGTSGETALEPRAHETEIVDHWTLDQWTQDQGEFLSGGVLLGGLSDLHPAGPLGSLIVPGGVATLWTITDRGPNGVVMVDGTNRRTLIDPAFVPSIAKLSLERGDSRRPSTVTVERVVPLRGRCGRPLSGVPNGVAGDITIYDHSGMHPLPSDPDGVDPEGLVALPEGGFWLAEEYRPSLLRVTDEGAVVDRYVPAGCVLGEADATVVDSVPADYSARRDNRGFEALAMSPDGERLYALVQSPLTVGACGEGAAPGDRSGNVRVLVFDPAAGRPLAEHVYRLGDPEVPEFLVGGAPPKDGKLCAMASIDASTLLVLEQADGGECRLYRVDLTGATDTLDWSAASAARPSLESVLDCPASGLVPVGKQLVADLRELRGAMLADVRGSSDPTATLKLEGLALVDGRHVLLVNDNDFALEGPARTCLWLVRLPVGLSP
jgi:hypothetical protein